MNFCLSDLVPPLRWSDAARIDLLANQPDLPDAWWRGLPVSHVLAVHDSGALGELLADLALEHWPAAAIGDLLPALYVLDPEAADDPQVAIALDRAGSWPGLLALSGRELADQPFIKARAVLTALFTAVFNRLAPARRSAPTEPPTTGQPTYAERRAAPEGHAGHHPSSAEQPTSPEQPANAPHPASTRQPATTGQPPYAERPAAPESHAGGHPTGAGPTSNTPPTDPPHPFNPWRPATTGQPAHAGQPTNAGKSTHSDHPSSTEQLVYPERRPIPDNRAGGHPTGTGPTSNTPPTNPPHPFNPWQPAHSGQPGYAERPADPEGHPGNHPATTGQPARTSPEQPAHTSTGKPAHTDPNNAGHPAHIERPAAPEGHVGHRPSSTGQPTYATQPAHTSPGQPTYGERPDNAGQPSRAEQPAHIERPAVPEGHAGGHPASTGQPAYVEQPGQTGQPTTTEQPAQTQLPASAEQPVDEAEPSYPPPPGHDLTPLIDSVLDGLDDQTWMVAQHRVCTTTPTPVAELARLLATSPAAIGRVETALRRRIGDWFTRPEAAPYRAHLAWLAETLGVAAPIERLVEAAPWHDRELRSIEVPVWQFLLATLPGYRVHDDWAVAGDPAELRARTRKLIMESDGPATITDALTRVTSLGIRAEVARQWLRSIPQLQVHSDDAGLVTSGRLKDVALTRRCFRQPDGRWWLRVDVTAEHLDGSEVPLPTGFAAYVGLTPGETRTVRSTVGELSVSWHSRPALSSLKSTLTDMTAEEGSHIFLTMSDEGMLRVRHLPSAPGSDAITQALRLVGYTAPGGGREQAERVIATRIGLTGGPVNREDLLGRLRERGDRDLLTLLG